MLVLQCEKYFLAGSQVKMPHITRDRIILKFIKVRFYFISQILFLCLFQHQLPTNSSQKTKTSNTQHNPTKTKRMFFSNFKKLLFKTLTNPTNIPYLLHNSYYSFVPAVPFIGLQSADQPPSMNNSTISHRQVQTLFVLGSVSRPKECRFPG